MFSMDEVEAIQELRIILADIRDLKEVLKCCGSHRLAHNLQCDDLFIWTEIWGRLPG